MKERLKGFMFGTITMVLVLGMVVTASATVGKRAVELDYNDIKVTLNGQSVNLVDVNGNSVEPFAIDGTTYLPVRAISSALDLDVEWEGNTKTVVLSRPNALVQGTLLYDDQYVSIAFDGIVAPEYEFFSKTDVMCIITNKTDVELTFQPSAISFDGISYQLEGSEAVAPHSTGRVRFACSEEIPKTASVSTGTISVVDFSYNLLKHSYEAKWVR